MDSNFHLYDAGALPVEPTGNWVLCGSMISPEIMDIYVSIRSSKTRISRIYHIMHKYTWIKPSLILLVVLCPISLSAVSQGGFDEENGLRASSKIAWESLDRSSKKSHDSGSINCALSTAKRHGWLTANWKTNTFLLT